MQEAVPRWRSSRQEAGHNSSNSSDASEGHDESPGFTAHWDLAGTDTQPPAAPQMPPLRTHLLNGGTDDGTHASRTAETGPEAERLSQRQELRRGLNGSYTHAEHQGADQRQLSKTNITRRESTNSALTARTSNACAESSSAYPPLTYSPFPPMSISEAGNTIHYPLPPTPHHTHTITMPHPASFPPPRPPAPVPTSHIKFASVADWLLPTRVTSKSGNEDEHENSDEDHESRSTGRASSVLPLTRQATVTISPVESRGPSRLHSVTGLPTAALLLGIWPQRSARNASSASGSAQTAAIAAAAEAEACSSLVQDMVHSADGTALSDDEDSSFGRKGRRRSLPSASQVPTLNSQSAQSHQQQRERLQQHDSMHHRRQRHNSGHRGSSGQGQGTNLDNNGERNQSPSGYTSSKPSQTGSSSRNTSYAGTATATSTMTGLAAVGVSGNSAELATLDEGGDPTNAAGAALAALLQRSSAIAPGPPLHSIITSAFSSFSSDVPSSELFLPGASACQAPAHQRSQTQAATHPSSLQQQQKRLRKLQRFASTPVVNGRHPVLPLSPTHDEETSSRRSSFSGSRAASAMFALDANYCAADSHASLRFSLGMSMGKHEQQMFPSDGLEQPGSPLRAVAPRKTIALQLQQQQQHHTMTATAALLEGSKSSSSSPPARMMGQISAVRGLQPIPKHLTIPKFARQSAPQTAWGGWKEEEGEKGQRGFACTTTPAATLEAAARAAQAESSEHLEMDHSIPITSPLSLHMGGWSSRLWSKSLKKVASGSNSQAAASSHNITRSEPSSSEEGTYPTSDAHHHTVPRTTRNKVRPVQPAAVNEVASSSARHSVSPTTPDVKSTRHVADSSQLVVGVRPSSTSPASMVLPPPPLRPSFFARLSSAHIMGSTPFATQPINPQPSASLQDPHPPPLSVFPPNPAAGSSSSIQGLRARQDPINRESDPHPDGPLPSNNSHSHSRSATPPGPVYLPFDHPQHDLLCACARVGTGDGRDSGNGRLTGGAGTRRNGAVDYSCIDPHTERLSAPTTASDRSSNTGMLRDLDSGRLSNPQRHRTSNQWLHNHSNAVSREAATHERTLRMSLESEPPSQGNLDREILSDPLASEWRQSEDWRPSHSGSLLISSCGAVRQAVIPSTESALESMLYDCMHQAVPSSPRSSLHYLSSVAQLPRGSHAHQHAHMMRQNQGLSLDTGKRSALLHCTTFPHTPTHRDGADSSSDVEEKDGGQGGLDVTSTTEEEEECEFSERPPQAQLQVLPRPLQSSRTLTPKKAWWKPWVGKPHAVPPISTPTSTALQVPVPPIKTQQAGDPAKASEVALPQGSLDSVLFVGAVQQVRQALQTPRPAHARARSHHPQLPTHPRQPLILRMPLGGGGEPPPPHTLSSSQLNHLTTADALLAAAAARGVNQQGGGGDVQQDAGTAKQGQGGRALSRWISGLPSWGRRKATT